MIISEIILQELLVLSYMVILLLLDILEVTNVPMNNFGWMMLYVKELKKLLDHANILDGEIIIVIGKLNVLNLFVLQEQLLLEKFS
jgi:hypothetical protein